MGVTYLKDGQDFYFPSEAGFTGSAAGRHDAKNHVDMDDDEYGDGTYVARAKGGRASKKTEPAKPTTTWAGEPHGYQMGGAAQMGGQAPGPSPAAQSPMTRATITMPVSDAAAAATGAVQAGKMAGARQALGGLAAAAQRARTMRMPAATMSPVAGSPPPMAPTRVPGMKKGGKFIQGMHMEHGALHRQLGIPEGEKIPAERLEKAAHSDNPLLAKRARTAEMLKGLSHKRKG